MIVMQIKQEKAYLYEMIHDGVSQYAAQCELVLPGEKPDVQAIIKADAQVRIKNRELSSGRMMLSGEVEFTVLYTPDEGGEIESISKSTEFTHHVDVGDAEDDTLWLVSANVEYANARSVDPRTLALNATCEFAVKIIAEGQSEYISELGAEQIELKTQHIAAMRMIGRVNKQFRINEDLEVNQSYAMKRFLMAKTEATITDTKFINNKIIIKGELVIRTTYLSSEHIADIKILSQSIPFSQIIDIPGVEENSGCMISADICSCYVKPIRNINDEITRLECEVYINVQCLAYRSEGLNLIEDAFCIDRDLSVAARQLHFIQKLRDIGGESTVTETIDFGMNAAERVVDVCAAAAVGSCRVADDEIQIIGKVAVQSLFIGRDGALAGVDGQIPFTITEQTDARHNDRFAFCDVKVVGISYTLESDTKMEVRIKLAYSGLLLSSGGVPVLTDAKLSETPRVSSGKTPELLIYYPDKAEQVWDIAKRYHTSPAMIRELNGLASDSIEGVSMLMIPKAGRISPVKA